MNNLHFAEILDTIFNQIKSTNETKGVEYTVHTGSKFHNFETVAEFLGLDRKQTLGVYLYKHISSIFAYIKLGGKVVSNEPIQGRIIDAILYLCLLYAMVENE